MLSHTSNLDIATMPLTTALTHKGKTVIPWPVTAFTITKVKASAGVMEKPASV